MIYWLDPTASNARSPVPATLWLSGDVDLADSEALEILGRDIQTLTDLHVDLGEVGYLGAALMSWLLSVRQALASHGGRLTLGRLTPRASSVLTLCGLAGCFRSSSSTCCHPRHVLPPAA